MLHYLPKKHKIQTNAADVRDRMAKAIIGQAVSLWVSPKEIVEGIVTHVRTGSDAPKVVVHGTEYPFSRILTSVPAAFAC